MCGLIAVQLTRAWLSDERLDTALASIAHRGPDGSASWFSQDRRTALGHVRLSIIGLNNGAQPLNHARGDLNAVVNGEFYGYKVIRDRLRERAIASSPTATARSRCIFTMSMALRSRNICVANSLSSSPIGAAAS